MQTQESLFILSAPDTFCRAESASGEPGTRVQSAQELGSREQHRCGRVLRLGTSTGEAEGLMDRHRSTRMTETRTGMGRQLQGRKEAAGRSGRDRANWMDGDGAKSQGWRWDGDRGTGGDGLGSSTSQYCRKEGLHPATAHRCPAWANKNALMKATFAHRCLYPPTPRNTHLVSQPELTDSRFLGHSWGKTSKITQVSENILFADSPKIMLKGNI